MDFDLTITTPSLIYLFIQSFCCRFVGVHGFIVIKHVLFGPVCPRIMFKSSCGFFRCHHVLFTEWKLFASKPFKQVILSLTVLP